MRTFQIGSRLLRESKHKQKGSRGRGLSDRTFRTHFAQMEALTPILKKGRELARGRAVQKRMRAARSVAERQARRLRPA